MADEPKAPLPPQNLAAEESLLGAMLLSRTAVEVALDVGLAARDFYRPSHGRIFDAAVSLYGDDKPVDAITVIDRLVELRALDKVDGGEGRVVELAAIVPAVGNARHYASIVKKMAVLRSLVAAGDELRTLGMEQAGELPTLIDRAERTVFDLALAGRTGDFVPLSEPLQEQFRRIDELGKSGSDIIGVPSGFPVIDQLTSGFQDENLIVLAARPSMGKSALALNIAGHVAVTMGKPVALFTLEMSRFEVTQRMLSAEALVQSQHIRNGRLDNEEWGRLTATAAKLHTAPLQIDDSGSLTAMELRAKARRLRLRSPDLALVIVDYLQLMTSGTQSDSRQENVSQTSRALKVLAADLGVPVLALSQLSRAVEQRHDKRPILSDLRESGAIEQDADVVMFLYRDEYYHPEDTDAEGVAELNIAKQRNGPTGTVKLAFVKRYTKFGTLATP